MLTPESFRQTFRMFSDPVASPDDAIDFWIAIAQNFLNGSNSSIGQRWDPTSLDLGVSLFVAHHLVLDQRDIATSQAGGVPGELKGPATAKAIDKVSQSYDTSAVTFENEGFWNQTRFGVQLLNMAYMFGAGGVQLGVCGGGGVSSGTWPIWSPYWPE